MKTSLLFILLIPSVLVYSQEREPEVLSFSEYLGYVKKYHPVARQAGLHVSRGEAELMKARGGFDPKIEVDYDRKEFKGTEYYDLLNSTFKIPIWYGLDLKASYEQNQGVYVNPQNQVPDDGLFSAGVTLAVGQGMFINERMAALRAARNFREQTLAERDLMVNQVLYEAAVAYFDWLQVFNEMRVYENFLENASVRFRGVKRSAELGEVAGIDTVEAKIALQDRRLQFEQARVRLMKQALEVSTFMWLEDVPVELQPYVIPDNDLPEVVETSLDIAGEVPLETALEDHPKLRALELKLRGLEIDRRLKANRLLPEINLEYNFLTQEPDNYETFNSSAYKAGISFNFPLFLRKERGELRLAEFKVQDAEFDLRFGERELENKLNGVLQELESYELQNNIAEEMVENYQKLLAGEERKFSFGESSIFLLNNRESKLIEARLKQNDVLNKYLNAKARLFNLLGINPEVL